MVTRGQNLFVGAFKRAHQRSWDGGAGADCFLNLADNDTDFSKIMSAPHTHTHTNPPAGQLTKNQRGSGIDSDTSYGSGGTQESRAEQVVQPLRARAHRCRPGAPLLLVRPSSTVVVAAPTAWGLRGRRVGRSTPSATSLGSRRRPTSRTVLGTPASHVCCSCARSI